MCASERCLLFAVVGVVIKQFTPLWTAPATVTWSIHHHRLPRRFADLVKVEGLCMALRDQVKRSKRWFRESPYWLLARPE